MNLRPPTPFRNLADIRFENFDSSHIERFAPMLTGSAFTPAAPWTELPDALRVYARPEVSSGVSGHKYASLTGTVANGTPIDVFIGELHLWSAPSESDREAQARRGEERTDILSSLHFLYVDVTLPFHVPHIRVHPETKAVSRVSGRANGVALESDFGDLYTVETLPGGEAGAYQILPPDTMLALLTQMPEALLEYQGNHLYIRVPLKQKMMQWNNPDGTRTTTFTENWDGFAAELKTIIAIVPELASSALTARIEPEAFTLLPTRTGTQAAKTAVIGCLTIPVALAVLIGGLGLISQGLGFGAFMLVMLVGGPVFVGAVIFFIVWQNVIAPRRRRAELVRRQYTAVGD